MQVLKPATRKKLKIIGDNYQEVVTEFLQTLPLFLGGTCSCVNCLGFSNESGTNGEVVQTCPGAELRSDCDEGITKIELVDNTNEIITETGLGDETNIEVTQTSSSTNHQKLVNVGPPHFYNPCTSMSREQVVRRTTIVGVVVLLMFIAFIWAARHVSTLPSL